MSDETTNKPSMAELVAIFERITTIPFAELVDAAGNTEKENELLNRMSENIKRESGRP